MSGNTAATKAQQIAQQDRRNKTRVHPAPREVQWLRQPQCLSAPASVVAVRPAFGQIGLLLTVVLKGNTPILAFRMRHGLVAASMDGSSILREGRKSRGTPGPRSTRSVEPPHGPCARQALGIGVCRLTEHPTLAGGVAAMLPGRCMGSSSPPPPLAQASCSGRALPGPVPHRRGPRSRPAVRAGVDAPVRPGSVLEGDLAFIQDHTGVDLLTPLGEVQDAHAEVMIGRPRACVAASLHAHSGCPGRLVRPRAAQVVAALNPLAGGRMQRELGGQIAELQAHLAQAHTEVRGSARVCTELLTRAAACKLRWTSEAKA